MLIISHRVNTIAELKNTPYKYGIEIDLRDYNGEIILQHDPYINGDSLKTFLQNYNHSFIILNIKSERIEFQVLEIINLFKIENYFFLDSSIPMINNLINLGERNIAIRYSEYESIETVINFSNKVKYVWVDCFHKYILTNDVFKILKNNNFLICIVSPELQNRESDVNTYIDFLNNNSIKPDFVCTKSGFIELWQNFTNL